MRHHRYNLNYNFVVSPEEFNKYTDRELLQFCLGATMYMPGTKDFSEAIVTEKYPGLTSMVMCLEDACREDEVPAAEDNIINMLSLLSGKIKDGSLGYEGLPLIIIRIRNMEEFVSLTDRMTAEHARVLVAFNFPKFNSRNGNQYLERLRDLNDKWGEIVYGMPIIEDRTVAYAETRMEELIRIRKILDTFRDLILNIRVGCTDFSGIFGSRRDVDYTIYDILPVSTILSDILNVFTRNNDYTVSGPVWEYFKINRSMKFSSLPKVDLQQSLLRRTPLINDEVDGLMRELILDKANGFVGKTIIHPSHIRYVNGMLAVTADEYKDAMRILSDKGGVSKSSGENRMNEVTPHKLWAEKIIMRSRAYGVIENEHSYIELFGTEM